MLCLNKLTLRTVLGAQGGAQGRCLIRVKFSASLFLPSSWGMCWASGLQVHSFPGPPAHWNLICCIVLGIPGTQEFNSSLDSLSRFPGLVMGIWISRTVLEILVLQPCISVSSPWVRSTNHGPLSVLGTLDVQVPGESVLKFHAVMVNLYH